MSWNRVIDKWTKKVPSDISKVQRKISLDLSSNVIVRTPVDTGAARGEWLGSFDTPASSPSGMTDKTGAATLAKISNVVSGFDGKSDQVFYLTNNAPHIVKLEYESHSPQAANGMVRVSVELIKRKYKRLFK